MRKTVLFATIISLIFSNCTARGPENNVTNTGINPGTNPAIVMHLSSETFKKMVFNYDVNKEWKYEGNGPAIIDFYADWCPPCRQLSPLVEEIAKEFNGRIVVYKVNTDKEKLLAQSLGITNLPTLLYIPAKGNPKVTLGYITKEKIVKTINEVLLIK